jgi:protein arginine N-methyltransferase 1
VSLSTLAEHYGYLSDEKRLAKFREAILAIIQPGDLVVDVGCGLGVLGLMCLRTGAARVWGIDSTDAIEIARETMAQAGLSDRYTCIRDSSFRATLPEPVDVIICDHVGYFGIDYGIIDMLGDVRRRFLRPGGRIMPSQIRLMIAGISSPACRAEAEAWGTAAIPGEYRWLRQYGVNTRHSRMFAVDEIATEPTILGTIDLNTNSPELLSFEASLNFKDDGVLDGLGGWFECELSPNTWMTNSPLSEEQIDRPQVFLALDSPIVVNAGENIKVSVTVRHDPPVLAWSVLDPHTRRWQKLSTWHSRILSEADLRRTVEKSCHLGREGQARGIVYSYINGERTAREIVEAVLQDHPTLFPSPEEIRRFVFKELARDAC